MRRTPPEPFVIVGSKLIKASSISLIEFGDIEDLRITVHHTGGKDVAEGIQAIEVLMLLKPSALESRRLRWRKRAWAVHNLIGHPLMQLLAFAGKYRLAMRVHDITVPRPLGKKPASRS